MRSLSNKRVYKEVSDSRVLSASSEQKIMMLYQAMKLRVSEMRSILNKVEEGLCPEDFERLKEKNIKIREICDFLISSIYVDGVCQSDGFDRLYHYIKGNCSIAFSQLDGSALSRADMAIDELIDIWKTVEV